MAEQPSLRTLLEQAQAALTTFDRARAHQLLTEAIHQDPNNEDAWGLLSNVVGNPRDRRQCLERALAINPHNVPARKLLAELDQAERAAAAPLPQGYTTRIVLLVAIILLVGWCTIGNSGTAVQSARRTSQPATHRVTYRVSGTASMAGLTYENAQGGTEQHDVALPWSTSLTVDQGAFLYLSVQNQGSFGDVQCEILVDDVAYKQSTTSADYGIASCSGNAH